MISISLPPAKRSWSTLSFSSTLYLCPILDLLLMKVPETVKDEVRLGLQEALVNAAKHGNKLDPSKSVVVQFSTSHQSFSWVISDQGEGFSSCCQENRECVPEDLIPPEDAENGRGLCILHEIFDHVHWNTCGNQLSLSKKIQ